MSGDESRSSAASEERVHDGLDQSQAPDPLRRPGGPDPVAGIPGSFRCRTLKDLRYRRHPKIRAVLLSKGSRSFAGCTRTQSRKARSGRTGITAREPTPNSGNVLSEEGEHGAGKHQQAREADHDPKGVPAPR